MFMTNELTLHAKRFDQLSATALYELLKLRSDVFVVEQQCIYQDMDDHDQNAIHVYGTNQQGAVVAYLRLLPKGETYPEVSLGRVLCTERHKGYASILLNYALSVAKETWNATCVEIEAQTYARGLYEKAGFVQTGPEFLEDGIPHIPMRLEF